MLGGLVMCTKGVVIHKEAMRRCGCKRGAQRVHINRYGCTCRWYSTGEGKVCNR